MIYTITSTRLPFANGVWYLPTPDKATAATKQLYDILQEEEPGRRFPGRGTVYRLNDIAKQPGSVHAERRRRNVAMLSYLRPHIAP